MTDDKQSRQGYRVAMVVAHRRTTGLRFLVLLVTLSVLVGVHPPHAAAEDPPAPVEVGQLEWSATINDHLVAEADSDDPVDLSGDTSVLELELTNNDLVPIELRSVRLEGRVMTMTFFRYTTRLDLVLSPGATTVRRIDLDLDDLTGHATGLIPARLQLVDQDLQVLDEDTFPVDVKGSLTSTYGVLGLAVAGITVVLLVELLLAIARGRLPATRRKRGRRFLTVGVWLGIFVAFALSATRQMTPSAPAWLSLVAIFAAAAVLLGYVLPIGSQRREIDLDDIESDAREDEYAGYPGAVVDSRQASADAVVDSRQASAGAADPAR